MVHALVAAVAGVYWLGAPPAVGDTLPPLVQRADTAAPAIASAVSLPLIPAQLDTPIVRRRTRAVEYSDAYNTRLTIHRWASYTEIPLFVAQYSLGENLLNDAAPPSWIRSTHKGVAWGVAGLFAVNTVTGAWNLWDSRHTEQGRTRRFVHVIAMLGADAGFAYTGYLGNRAHTRDFTLRTTHRNWALGSMALATASTAMMWFWKD